MNNIYAVTCDNDEWPEDRNDAIAIVAAPDKDTAIQLVKDDPTFMHTNRNYDADEIHHLETALDTPTIITHYVF